MAVTLNALTTGVGGLQTTGDTSGQISLQSNGSTVLAVTASGVSVTGTLSSTSALPIASGGTNNDSLAVTAGGALYTDGTKVVNVGAGTSGQLLQSNGASAPSWATVSTESRTLLGTITASGNSVSLTGLDLTPYYALYIIVNGVSTNNNGQFGYLTFNNTNTVGADVVYVGNIAQFNWYPMYLDLTTGFVTFSDQTRATLQTLASASARGGSTGIINSSTAIYFRMGSTAVFDAGTFIIYGMK